MAARAWRDFDLHVRTRLLARVAAGERLWHVCGEAGMPCYGSVRAWARAEPEFAAALEQARATGQWRRDAPIDEAVAKALLARLAGGVGIVSVLRDPAMPSRRVYRIWRSQYGWFAEEVWRINQERRGAKLDRCRARRRDFDPVLADRIVARVAMGTPLDEVLTADPGLPGRGVVTRWRRENREFGRALAMAIRARRQWALGRARCTAAMADAVCERIFEGETLATIGRRPGMPCRATLYAWMKRVRPFRDAVAAAWDVRADRLADQVLEIAGRDGSGLAGRRREIEGLRAKVARLEARAVRWGEDWG
jgi:hypothetical protein